MTGEPNALLEALAEGFSSAISNGHPDASERSYRLIFSFPNMEAMHRAQDAYVRAVAVHAPEPVDRKQKMDALWKVLREYRLEDGQTVAELIKSGHDRISVLSYLVDALTLATPARTDDAAQADHIAGVGNMVASPTTNVPAAVIAGICQSVNGLSSALEVLDMIAGNDWFPTEAAIKEIREMAHDARQALSTQAAYPTGAGEGLSISDAWQDLVDKDDRTSPEEYPDMALITREELADYMQAAKVGGK